jgi:hypothetical protein
MNRGIRLEDILEPHEIKDCLWELDVLLYARDKILAMYHDYLDNEFFIEGGEASRSVRLEPGFWNIVTQGRAFFTTSRRIKDGSAWWTYSYSITEAIPEPSTLAGLVIVVIFSRLIRKD